MPAPKFTTAEIEADLAKLERGGLRCAVYYLEAELNRRKASASNAGRPIELNTPKAIRQRKASADYRERLKSTTNGK